MPLWELTPVDLLDSNWEASSHRGKVIVRAPREAVARDEAENAFGVKTRFEPGGGVKAPPWKRPAVVTAKIIQDDRYEENGPTAILFPAL